MMDDRKEAEKWEHLEELRLWMKMSWALCLILSTMGLARLSL
jgi:hypothetical protein